MTDASDQAQPETPTMTQIIQVLQPQVERIEDAFRSIRVTLEALQDHLQSDDSPEVSPTEETVIATREELALADEPAGPPPPPIELPEATDEAEEEAEEDPEPATLPPPVATPVPTATPAPVPPPSPAHPSPAPEILHPARQLSLCPVPAMVATGVRSSSASTRIATRRWPVSAAACWATSTRDWTPRSG